MTSLRLSWLTGTGMGRRFTSFQHLEVVSGEGLALPLFVSPDYCPGPSGRSSFDIGSCCIHLWLLFSQVGWGFWPVWPLTLYARWASLFLLFSLFFLFVLFFVGVHFVHPKEKGTKNKVKEGEKLIGLRPMNICSVFWPVGASPPLMRRSRRYTPLPIRERGGVSP